MEYKSPYKVKYIFIIFFLIFAFNSCGYFDNDKLENKITVAGRIQIIKSQNNNFYSLVLSIENNVYEHIVNNCRTIHYDKDNSIIYTDEFLNDNYILYHKLYVIDSTSYEINKAIKIQEIDKRKFDEINTKNIMFWQLQD